MIGTPANKEILREAGMLDADGAQAAARATWSSRCARATPAPRDAALAEARRLLDQPRAADAGAQRWRPRTLRARACSRCPTPIWR